MASPLKPFNHERRELLRRGSALSTLGLAAPWALNLAALGEAAAPESRHHGVGEQQVDRPGMRGRFRQGVCSVVRGQHGVPGFDQCRLGERADHALVLGH